MSIEQTLRQQLTEALKAKDRRTADVIRMIDTKVMERRTAKGFRGPVDDALYLDVISAYRKSLVKALEDYETAGDRGKEQAEQLRFEIDFLSRFLPEPLSEDEVRAAVRQAIADLGASGPGMTGRVIGAVMKQHKDRANPALVKRIAAEELA